MKFRPFVLLACVAALGLAACEDDPAGTGVPFAISTNASTLTVNANVQTTITAFVLDHNNRRINGALAAQPPAAPLQLDSTVYVSELSETRFFVTGTGAIPSPGGELIISGQGLTDTVFIIVNAPAGP